MIKIFIADDHLIIREGLKRIVKDESDIKVVGESVNAAGVFEFLKDNQCDVLVLDINLPDKSGLEVLKNLKTSLPELKVLILSASPEERYATRVLKIGAMGYLNKDTAAEELVRAIKRIASGKKYVSQSLGEKLALGLDPTTEKSPIEILSDRELEVLVLLASGKTQVEIAATLSLGPSSVNTYRSRVLEKLNFTSNAELIRYAIDNNLIE